MKTKKYKLKRQSNYKKFHENDNFNFLTGCHKIKFDELIHFYPGMWSCTLPLNYFPSFCSVELYNSVVYVVVQFYPRFNFDFLFFDIHYHMLA